MVCSWGVGVTQRQHWKILVPQQQQEQLHSPETDPDSRESKQGAGAHRLWLQ